MIIIVGAGISGLYLGYLLHKQEKEFIILEKDARYGGRVQVDNFEGESVVLGAGIGRLEKDKTLYDLCISMDVPVHKYTSKISRVFSKERQTELKNKNFSKEVDKVNEWSKELTKQQRSKTDMVKFLRQHHDPLDFIDLSGYTDYLHADVIDTVQDYGFDDMIPGYTGFSIEWDVLLDKLYELMKDRIHLSEGVLEHNTKKKSVRTNITTYSYDQLVCSTPVTVARKLFPTIETLRDLDGQPFSRIYAKIEKGKEKLSEKVKNFTIVDSYLQKIIPINAKKGIYMIGYNDNIDSIQTMNYFNNLSEEEVYHKLSNEIKHIFGIDVEITVAKIAFWDYGTTYYKPLPVKYANREEWLKKARNPVKNIYFAGEGFSRNQGWVQGSLESVDAILPSLG